MATHFTGPVLNRERLPADGLRAWFSSLPVGHDPDYVRYFNDFVNQADYAAADWTQTITQAGSGNASIAIATGELNGGLLITNDNADDDNVSQQLVSANWKVAVGKRAWFETKIKVSDPTQADLMVGFAKLDTTPLDATHRCVFRLTDGSAALACETVNASTATTTTAIATLVADTYVTLSFYWDGASAISYFVNRGQVATHTTNVPTSQIMSITVHLQNGEAVIKTATIDYIFAAMER